MTPTRAGALPSGDDAGRVMEVVDRIARKAASPLDLAELSRGLAVEVQDALQAELAAVLLVEGGELRYLAASGAAATAFDGLRVPLSAGVVGKVARTGRSALAVDGLEEADGAPGFRPRTLVAAPLIVQGRTVGVVAVADRRPGAPEFGPADRHLLDRLAPHLAAAVTNATFAAELARARDRLARHHEEVERRVWERTRAIGVGKREWELAFDSIPDALAIVEGGAVRRTNLAYSAASGLDVRQLPGLPCHVARFGKDRPCAGCPIQGDAPDVVEAELLEGGGAVQVRGFRLHDPARPDAWVVSYRDVSEHRRTREKAAEAERLSAVGRLAAGAAHEINNPMAFVASALRTLREHVADLTSVASLGTLAAGLAAAGKDEQALRALARVNEKAAEVEVRDVADDVRLVLDEADSGVRRVTAIVQALKVLGREEFGHDEPFDLSVVLERAVERARKAGPFPRVSWLRREPVHVFGRPLQFDQAFFEVARNAGQACPPGQGSLRLSCGLEHGAAVIELADDGAGIAGEHLPRIFEPFFTTRGVGGGVGLGLTIAYGVVRRHGGTVEVDSRPGRGTTVRVVVRSTPPPRSMEDAGPQPDLR